MATKRKTAPLSSKSRSKESSKNNNIKDKRSDSTGDNLSLDGSSQEEVASLFELDVFTLMGEDANDENQENTMGGAEATDIGNTVGEEDDDIENVGGEIMLGNLDDSDIAVVTTIISGDIDPEDLGIAPGEDDSTTGRDADREMITGRRSRAGARKRARNTTSFAGKPGSPAASRKPGRARTTSIETGAGRSASRNSNTVNKGTAKKSAAKKGGNTKAAAKKSAAKKSGNTKSTARKGATKTGNTRSAVKKSAPKKSAPKKSGNTKTGARKVAAKRGNTKAAAKKSIAKKGTASNRAPMKRGAVKKAATARPVAKKAAPKKGNATKKGATKKSAAKKRR